MKFSVIIPAYNAGIYLNQCVNSIIDQDYPTEDYEILIVDDASPDPQESYIHELCSNNPNVHYIKHPLNKRQGGARNTAMKIAKGDWVLFIDSDDCWLYNNVLSTFAEIIGKYPDIDIVRFKTYISIPHDFSPRIEGKSFKVPDHYDIKDEGAGLCDSNFNYIIWTSCYKRLLVTDNGIWFREKVSFEDSDWATEINFRSRKAIWLDGAFYGYRQTEVSTTRSIVLKTFQDNVASIFAISDLIDKYDMPDDIKAGCNERIKKSILSYIKISRYFHVNESMLALSPLFCSRLMDSGRYNMNLIERLKFWLLKHMPRPTLYSVRLLARFKCVLTRFKCALR